MARYRRSGDKLQEGPREPWVPAMPHTLMSLRHLDDAGPKKRQGELVNFIPMYCFNFSLLEFGNRVHYIVPSQICCSNKQTTKTMTNLRRHRRPTMIPATSEI